MNAADKQIKDWHEAEMKMSKHTPGPWSYRKVPRKQEWEIDTKRCPNLGHESWTGMSVVFGCDDYPKMGKIVGEANARLIAAAPELLEALELLMKYSARPSCESLHHDKKYRHTALEPCPAEANLYQARIMAEDAIAKATGEQ